MQVDNLVITDLHALHVGSNFCLCDFTELSFLSVGSQLPPRTLKYIDGLID